MSLEIYETEVTADKVTIRLRDNPEKAGATVRQTLVLPNQPGLYDFDKPLVLAHLKALHDARELIETKMQVLIDSVRRHPERILSSDRGSYLPL